MKFEMTNEVGGMVYSSGLHKGKPIILNSFERSKLDKLLLQVDTQVKERAGKHANSLGAQQVITTLTYISKDVSEQTFYTVNVPERVPMKLGEGSFETSTLVYRAYQMASQFENGYVNTGVQSSRAAMSHVGVDALTIQHLNWKEDIKYNIMDIEFAARANNWDLVSELERARKKNWDLGIQRIAFLGANGQNGPGGNCFGLLNQPTSVGITTNTSLITAPINTYSTTQLQTLSQNLLATFLANNNYTCMPNRFLVPFSDWLGMAAFNSPEFPILTIVDLLENMFKKVTENPNFKVLPVAYADATNNQTGNQIYTLYNHDPYAMFMSIPLNYTVTLPDSLNNFDFQNTAYGQHTGVLVLKPLEMLYFTYPS